jgi:hypothetical protein
VERCYTKTPPQSGISCGFCFLFEKCGKNADFSKNVLTMVARLCYYDKGAPSFAEQQDKNALAFLQTWIKSLARFLTSLGFYQAAVP